MSELYAELDSRIVDAVKNFGAALYNKKVRQEARRIAELTGRDEDRVIDGRVQSLRKRGVIKYVRGKWYVRGEI